MPLKTHLIIVGSIILCVFIGWQILLYSTAQAPQPQNPQTQGRAIEIIRASFGLNCVSDPASRGSTLSTAGDFAFKEGSDSIKENNALQTVSERCNLKTRCTIINQAEWVGFDPAPKCYSKLLSVEYRCFSFDRPWLLTVQPHERADIDCEKQQ